MMRLSTRVLMLASVLLFASSEIGAEVCVTTAVLRVDNPDQVWVISCSGPCGCFKVSDGSTKWCDCDPDNMTSPPCCHAAVTLSGSEPTSEGTCEACPETGPCVLVPNGTGTQAWALCLPFAP